jgi:uncharacterized DUF497 family protein
MRFAYNVSVLHVRKLLWNDANKSHLLASHGVLPVEVDEIIFGIDAEEPNYDVRRDGPNYVVEGETSGGRLLVIIALEPKGAGLFRPFAAREMEDHERRKYRSRRKTR